MLFNIEYQFEIFCKINNFLLEEQYSINSYRERCNFKTYHFIYNYIAGITPTNFCDPSFNLIFIKIDI